MTQPEKITRIRELTSILNEANLSYYQRSTEIMSNREYDKLYDELLALENETSFRLSNSPTQNVGHEIISDLAKERHETRMLSLDKTKDPDELLKWMGSHRAVISWKLDGITCVVTYASGTLQKAVTRGNGEIGEIVTNNARYFENLPLTIPFKGRLVIRGEAVISYSNFEKINSEAADISSVYKNPRNLTSGSVRVLDPMITKRRHVKLIVFTLVSVSDGTDQISLSPDSVLHNQSGDTVPESLSESSVSKAQAESERVIDSGSQTGQKDRSTSKLPDFRNSFSETFSWLQSMGFEVVEHFLITPDELKEQIAYFKSRIPTYDIPSDGLVLTYEDIAYGLSLGTTAKFPRNSIAFKWQDELADTTLQKIDWSGSRTGLINPVAVFDPVELEGTIVSRASVHNVSIVKELRLGYGDKLTVYKSNMIIPQVNENLTKSGTCPIPDKCPVCGSTAKIKREGQAEFLYCENPDCPAKKIKSFSHMVSRNALNIEGLSESTLEKLIDEGFIKEYADCFKLSRYREKIASLPGFGEKSAENIIQNASQASLTECRRYLYGLGVPGIGTALAATISAYFGNDPLKFMEARYEDLITIDDVGETLAGNFVKFFSDPQKRKEAINLLSVISFRNDLAEQPSIFAGKTFVVTGTVKHFKNRAEIYSLISDLGGRTGESVTKSTDYLINNDPGSTSSKNKKARQMNIPIISEEEFMDMLPAGRRPNQ